MWAVMPEGLAVACWIVRGAEALNEVLEQVEPGKRGVSRAFVHLGERRAERSGERSQRGVRG